MKTSSSFLKLLLIIVSNLKYQDKKKKHNHHLVIVQSVHKQLSLAYLCKNKFTLCKCHRSFDQCFDFLIHLFFTLLWNDKEFIRGNPKSR